MRRHVAAFAVIVLALVSAPAVHLDYAPDLQQPEVTVALETGAETDPEELTARWVVPIESAIRSLGDVIATRGEITADAATVTVRFRPGTHAELKTARLASELAGLRRRLPRDARLFVWPSQQSGSRPSAFLAVPRAADAKRIADELRGVIGVRDVQVFGGTEIETVVELQQGSAEEVRERIASSATPHPLGANVFGVSRPWPVASYQRFTEPRSLSRLNGKPAVMLAVIRDPDVSLFRFDAALRARAAGEEVWSEARELRALLLRLAIGALAATLLLAACRAALYVPLSIALAVNLARITDAHIDHYTLIAAAIAIAAVAPFAATRRRPLWSILFFAILPIATSYLAPSLTRHAIAFTATATCALFGVRRQSLRFPIRAAGSHAFRLRHAFKSGGLAAALQRNAFSVALTAIALAILLLSWFGPALDPRKTAPTDRGRLYLTTTLPAGTTLTSTTEAIARLEAALKEDRDVQRFWTILTPAYARTVVELDEDRKRLFRFRLPELARHVPGTVTANEFFSRAAGGDLEDQPEADPSGVLYRVLLKSTDAEVLRRIYEELANRLARMDVRREWVEPEWGASTSRIELIPRPHVTMDAALRAAATLIERTFPSQARMLPDGRLLRVIAPRAPASFDDVPQRADVAIPPLFIARDAVVPGRVTRELGRYVLPVTVHVPGYGDEKLKRRVQIDRSLATMTLPAGAMIERPPLAEWAFSKEKLRLLSLAAFLPLLLIAAACIVLSSFPRALVACAPALLGISLAAPLLLLARARTDEITIVALAAAVCGTLPIAIAARATYRDLRETLRPLFIAALAGAAFLAIAATEDVRGPLLGAAAVLFVSTSAGTLLPTTILTSAREAKRRVNKSTSRRVFESSSRSLDDSTARRLDTSLSVHHLTKTYGTLRALHDVSFDLTPGVIGLLGPNGAGKTTLLRTLTGLLTPTRGQVLFRGVPVDAENLAEYRRHIGFLPQEFNAYSGLTGAQFLRYWMLERGVDEDADRLLKLVGLEGHADRRVRDYSGGMRQRIGIARALIGGPPILVVDEPTTGLDVEARASFRELMQSLAKDRIIIISTHIASDVEATASRILLLVRGHLRWDGTPDALIAAARGRVFETTVSDPDARTLSRAYRVTKRVRTQQGIRLRGVARAEEDLPGASVEPTLEEAYLALASEGQIRLGSFSFLADAR